MKIREITSHVLRHPRPEAEVFGSSKGWHSVRQALVVEIVTDEGLTGFGEAYGPPQPSRALVDELYAPRLVGRDPLERAVYPHVWATAVGLFASLQLTAALPPNPPALVPGEPLFELDRTPNPLRDQLAQNPPKRAGDVLEVPAGPGLGLELDRRVLERYRV